MMHADRDALLCDLAETYHVYDLKALPVQTLAALSFGLRDDSRIKMKMAGMVYVSPVILQAEIVDNLALIRYSLCMKEHSPLPEFYTDIISGKKQAEQAARANKQKDTKYLSVRNAILDDVRSRLNEDINNG